MAPQSNRPEKFDFQFFGMHISSNNPGPRSNLQLAMLLLFFLILFLIWKPLGLGILLAKPVQQLPGNAKALWDKVKRNRNNKAA